MKHNWTMGILSGFVLAAFLAGCEAKKDESSQAPQDQSRSLAGQPEKREAPMAPQSQPEERPGAGPQQDQPGRPG
jgi:hypothetical protein